jgi:hypothetical protein
MKKTKQNKKQNSLGIPSQSNKVGRRNKRNTNTKGKEVKLSLFSADRILYLKEKKIHPKTPRQSSRIQNQLTKISSLSVYQQ